MTYRKGGIRIAGKPVANGGLTERDDCLVSWSKGPGKPRSLVHWWTGIGTACGSVPQTRGQMIHGAGEDHHMCKDCGSALIERGHPERSGRSRSRVERPGGLGLI